MRAKTISEIREVANDASVRGSAYNHLLVECRRVDMERRAKVALADKRAAQIKALVREKRSMMSEIQDQESVRVGLEAQVKHLQHLLLRREQEIDTLQSKLEAFKTVTAWDRD